MILPINTACWGWIPGTCLVFIHSTWEHHHGKHCLEDSFPKAHHHKKKKKKRQKKESSACIHQPLSNVFWSCNFLSCQPKDKNKRTVLHLSTAKAGYDNKCWSPVKQASYSLRQRSFNSWYSCRAIQILAWFSLQFVCLPHSDMQPDFWTLISPDFCTSLWYRSIYHTHSVEEEKGW